MPRYVINFHRTVVQVAKLEIEAESQEDARGQADTLVDEFDPDAVKLTWVDDSTYWSDVDWEQVELIEEE